PAGSLAEQLLDGLDVGGRDHLVLGEAARALGRLVLEQVTAVGLLAHDLPAARDAEALLGTRVRLVLRHDCRLSLCPVSRLAAADVFGSWPVGPDPEQGRSVLPASAGLAPRRRLGRRA